MDTFKKFHKNSFLTITITGFLTIGLFLFLQFSNQRDSFLNDISTTLSGIVFLISAIICFLYYKKINDKSGVSLNILMTGLSNLLFAIGSFIWSYYNLFLNIEAPYPSIADFVFIFMALTYAIAVGSLLQVYKSSTKPSSIFIATLVFVILVGIMFKYVGNPEISSESSFLENFFNFAYALSDSIYVGSGVALLIIAGGKIFKGISVWVLAMFIITIADIIFTYRAAEEIVWNGDISDQLYTLSAIIFTYAVILLAKFQTKKYDQTL